MRYYCVKQHDITDCGAACLATICRQNGYKIGITRIREVAGTDKQGTNAYGGVVAGAGAGSAVPGIGTVAGGILGGIGGASAGFTAGFAAGRAY